MKALDKVTTALRDPNPIVRNELLETVRSPRYVRTVVVALIALAVLMVSVALGASERDDTTETGRVLFQIFMGGCFVVMALVGPTLGATAVVQEREANTLDALVLSGLGPPRIVWGKLIAVFAAMAFIPLVSIPMLGAVVLFGGVSLGHIVVATFWVMVLGALGVARGVAVSARSQSTRLALLGVLPISFVVTFVLGSFLGAFGHDFARRNSLSIDGPFFFADAYFVLPFGKEYLATLVIFPVTLTALSFWLSWAIAHGGLREPTQDCSLPLKRWALGAAVIAPTVLAVCVRLWGLSASTRNGVAEGFITLTGVIAWGLTFAFVGEAQFLSRRMVRERPGPIVRFLMPPTVAPSIWFIVVVSAVTMVLSPTVIANGTRGIALFGLWSATSIAALASFMGWLALRKPNGAASARLWGAVWLFVTMVLLWLVAAITGQARDGVEHPAMVLIVSPSWAVMAAATAYTSSSMRGVSDVNDGLLAGAIVQSIVSVVFLSLMHRASGKSHLTTVETERP